MNQQLIMNKKLIYLTYQTFPADTANSIQTTKMLKYFSKKDYQVKLIFPKRSKYSSSDKNVLEQQYDLKINYEIELFEHNYLFKDYEGKVLFKKLRFHLSHFLWSRKAVNRVTKIYPSETLYFTRSDWIFYFLSRKKKNVTFECHQLSKVRKLVLSRSIKNRKSKVVFTHELLKKDFFKNSYYNKQIIIAHNSFDDEFFNSDSKEKISRKVIFVGSLLRFNENRGLSFLMDVFNDSRLKEYTLEIIGGPEKIKSELASKIQNSNIKLTGRKSHAETIQKMEVSDIGILINSSKNKHSTHHTSPLKFFEYLRAGLKIVAVDFPSHRNLPFSEKIFFFQENNRESLIKAILQSGNLPIVDYVEISQYSYEERVNKILEFMARPEGLEPPTL